MTILTVNTKELFGSLDHLAGKYRKLLEKLSDDQVNNVPFHESWTAGQLTEHVINSIAGITKAMNIEGKATNRHPEARVAELEEMFLDYTVRYQSPAFILPTQHSYHKETITRDLEKSLAGLKEEARKVNLSEAINHTAFGEITRMELLHFVKVHSERHLHQLKNIVRIIKHK